ncbi:MAG: TetR/AcrR family transcriptional regulator [Desulfobacterales bacterium]|nr:TetR/AcrR family transcriptional regulator [Desulfobacterales bacterium]
MKNRDKKRADIADRTAAYMLKNGIHAANLRALANALGTSDRMILHYFENKDDLMDAAMTNLIQGLVRTFEEMDSPRLPPDALIPVLAEQFTSPGIRPYVNLWLELLSLSLHDANGYIQHVRKITDMFHGCISSLLAVEHEQDREATASYVLAILDGLILMKATGQQSLIDSALAGIAIAANGASRDS